MAFRSFISLSLILVLAGCQLPLSIGGPGAERAALQASATEPGSLPFKTVLVDPLGQGRFMKAGESETVVLQSREELDAFLARHPQAVAPVYASPSPQASVGPPSGIPFGSQPPPFQPEPIPEEVKALDFTKYVAIAFFDGAVTVASTSRIVAVQAQGDRWVVSTQRWEPPPNPAAIPDQNGRLHIIALARPDKPATFLPTTVTDGSSGPRGGGYGVGGNPVMRPQWPAVPNPEITREQIETMARGMYRDSKVTSFDLQLAPLSSAHDEAARSTNFTPESLVWIARLKGELQLLGGGGPKGGTIGAGTPTTSEVMMVISPEDGQMLTSVSFAPIVQDPGMRFELLPHGDLHLGETLRFNVHGKPVAGTLTMTLSSGAATPVVKRVPLESLADFSLTLDPKSVPLLTGADLQPLTITLDFETSGNQRMTETREIRVMRDASAKQTPPMRIQGSGRLEDYKIQPGESAADAFVRDIATSDWQGADLQTTSRNAVLADMPAHGNQAIDLAPSTPVRVYEVRGRFPTFLVLAVTSATGADQVMAPARLEIAVTEELPIRVVSLKAFPK